MRTCAFTCAGRPRHAYSWRLVPLLRAVRVPTGFTAYVSHLLTPESARSTHYFWTFARDSRKGDRQFDTHLQASISRAFLNEDAPIIEWQEGYEQLADCKTSPRQILRGDAGAMR